MIGGNHLENIGAVGVDNTTLEEIYTIDCLVNSEKKKKRKETVVK